MSGRVLDRRLILRSGLHIKRFFACGHGRYIVQSVSSVIQEEGDLLNGLLSFTWGFISGFAMLNADSRFDERFGRKNSEQH
jgi:hypothetical protein